MSDEEAIPVPENDLREVLALLSESGYGAGAVAARVRALLPPKPPEEVRNRILWNARGENDIDEIVLHDAIVHIEQMNTRCWWIGIQLPDEKYWSGNFSADSRGRMSFSEQDNIGVRWDDDSEHVR